MIPVRIKLIACEILYRELCACIARSTNQVDLEFLPKGLHDMGSGGMRERLQAVVDAIDVSRYETIALGYALCGTGLAGLTARGRPLVLPRAHDCVSLFLGSHQRYLEYFTANPGVFFKTTGWIERGQGLEQLATREMRDKTGVGMTYAQLVEKYGEDNAQFLFEQLGNYQHNYGQLTFIEMGIEPDGRFEQSARDEAARLNWRFEKVPGDLGLLQRLVDGDWSGGDFLVVPPGWRIAARHDDRIMDAEEA
jgi:hypothetical protein